MRDLGRLDAIPDGAARGFPAPRGGFTGLFAVRRGGQAHVFVNACPHVGVALDRPPNNFLTPDGTEIRCNTHGARFAIPSGLCTAGPCEGSCLEPVRAEIVGGHILVPEDAGL